MSESGENVDFNDDEYSYGPTELDRNGDVITFYSFKGGVGRSMALANTAFIAASSGKKVLIMDWDLEAPGLAYYFRGVQDPAIARGLKSAPGVLNFLWEWVNRVRTDSKASVEEAVAAFDSGAPFKACIRQLVAPQFFDTFDGSIDYIGAGSPIVETPDRTHYEDALAKFPWHDFFARMAGGYAAHSLRKWAKSHYDLVLIDSRTGLAESAGVCTMQLPDTVALCFVFNRQNIEGIARIAASIRAAKPEVKLVAAPMRVSREGTPEENEARAKAIADLTRQGVFSADTVAHHLQALAVKHADSVPFYESLASIVAQDPSTDPLLLNYLRFARELTGYSDLLLIDLDEDLVSRARARLQPQLATAEYVEKLLGSEPLRAITELERLISSAEELVATGEQASLGDHYLSVLTAVTFEPRTLQFPDRALALQEQALNVLRMLVETNAEWESALAEALEAHLSTFLGQFELEDEVALREELDELYEPSSIPVAELKRLENRRRVAWLTYRSDNEVAAHSAAELFEHVLKLRASGVLGEAYADELLYIEADLLHLKGLTALKNKERVIAKEFLERAVSLCVDLDWDNARSDLKRSIAEVHALLATTGQLELTEESRRDHALRAARINGPALNASSFSELLKLMASEASIPDLRTYLDLTLGSPTHSSRISPIALMFARNATSAARFLKELAHVVALLASERQEQNRMVLQRMASIADLVVSQVSRRRSIFNQVRPLDVAEAYSEFVEAMRKARFEWHQNPEVDQALEILRIPRNVPPPSKR